MGGVFVCKQWRFGELSFSEVPRHIASRGTPNAEVSGDAAAVSTSGGRSTPGRRGRPVRAPRKLGVSRIVGAFQCEAERLLSTHRGRQPGVKRRRRQRFVGDHELETPPGEFARPDVPGGRHSERNRRGQPFAGHPPRLSSAVLDALRGTFSRMRGRLGLKMLPPTGFAPREDEVASSGCPHPLVTVQGFSTPGATRRRQGVSVLVQLWVNPSLTSGVRGGGEGEAKRTWSHPSAASVLFVRKPRLRPGPRTTRQPSRSLRRRRTGDAV